MRMRHLLGLSVLLATPAMAQDTSVVVRGMSRDGVGSNDTTIIIRRRGKEDQVIRVTPKLNRELRLNLERQIEESRRAMAGMRESSRAMEARGVEMARGLNEMSRRQAEVGGRMQALELARPSMRMDTVRISELRSANEALARTRGLGDRSMQVFLAKPRIGLTVSIVARETDRYGAYVEGVTPGGPAAKAGIRAADIITKIGGKSLTAPDSIRREAGSSVPGFRLLQLVSRLEAGKSVEFEYRRGNDNRKTSVTPADDDTFTYYVDGVPVQGGAGVMVPRSGGGGVFSTVPPSAAAGGRMAVTPRGTMSAAEVPFETRFFENFARTAPGDRIAMISAFGGPLADLELAPLNEKLGSYFGVTEGVLVIDVPEKDNLGLLPGDVITAIDSRKVSSPSQLFRVLGTYDRGEDFKLQITRQRKAETITSKAP